MTQIQNKQITHNKLGLIEFYSFYKKHIEENKLPEKYKIDRKKISKIVKMFHKEVANDLLRKNLVFILPHLAFRIRVGKFKKKLLDKNGNLRKHAFPVDWKATRELWKEKPELKEKGVAVYHLNDHSDGYIYTIKMNHGYNIRIKNSSLIKFKAARNINREIKTIVSDPYNKIDYYEL